LAATSDPAATGRERAETYLRVQAEAELQRARYQNSERWISSGWRLPGDTRPAKRCMLHIAAIARALTAAGVIDDPTASDVLADLQAALAIRSLIPTTELLSGPRGVQGANASVYFPVRRLVRTPAAPVPMRLTPAGAVAVCEVGHQRIRVHLASLVVDGNSAAVGIRARLAPDPVARSPLLQPWDIHNSCTAADDQGGTYGMHFSGGGAEGYWKGLLHITPVPPPAVRWLDVSLPGAEPVRLRLDAPQRDLATSKISLRADEAAERYLDGQTVALLSSDDEEDGKDPRVAWAALGLLSARVMRSLNPALRRLVAVTSQLGLDLPEPLAAIPAGPLPADWLSLVARRDCRDGPNGTVPVAATLPELDAAQCAIADIHSSAVSAGIEVHARAWPGPLDPRQPWREVFRWTARDDIGGWYATTVRDWSYGDATADMTLSLCPVIDPAARHLQIILTSRSGEVSMTVPLDWQEGL
jgi:hypothetical protein